MPDEHKVVTLEEDEAKAFIDIGITQDVIDAYQGTVNDPERVYENALRGITMELMAIVGSNNDTGAYYRKHLGKVIERCHEALRQSESHGPDDTTFGVVGIVSSQDSRPLVNIFIHGEGAVLYTQVSITKAYEIAQAIIEAAESAITDTFILKFAQDFLGLEDDRSASILGLLRDFRKRMPIRRGWMHV
jgi:hypothetical protein